MDTVKSKGLKKLFDKHVTLIITDEKQLERIINDPDKPFNLDDDRGYSGEKQSIYNKPTSLVDICKQGVEKGAKRLEVSYDYFFGGTKRKYYPDDTFTIKAFKVIHDVAAQYGLGFSASVLSPLDIGPGYAKAYKQTGETCQFQENGIDERTGVFSTLIEYQTQWTNNKGPIKLKLKEWQVYAFHERQIEDSDFYYVNPDTISDITDHCNMIIDESKNKISKTGYGRGMLSITGSLPEDKKNDSLNRILAIITYETPEIDYFSDFAWPYIKSILDQHADAGITYSGFYSDEMHIQFDWDLISHFGLNEIRTRYITDSLMAHMTEKFDDAKFGDLRKYLIYFAYGHQAAHGLPEHTDAQHVFGQDDTSIHQTIQMRSRYFEALQKKVVNLALQGKAYAEEINNRDIMTRAHATWQEAPTCDRFYAESKFQEADDKRHTRYEYTPEYVWSSSIRENMSACYDYFKWNQFLTGGGTDHPEGGFIDRNYYAQALAVSFGLLNQYPLSYCASWGSPADIKDRQRYVRRAFGNLEFSADIRDVLVQGLEARKSEVLALYPLELNPFAERFGSWMVQYGYCDYISEEMLLKHVDFQQQSELKVSSRSYRCLLVLFQPLLKQETLELLEKWVQCGGKVVWISVPLASGTVSDTLLQRWSDLFGIQKATPAWKGKKASHQQIRFSDALDDIEAMPVLSDLLPDRVYSVYPDCRSSIIAWCGDEPVGVCKKTAAGGLAAYLGFRPRDDQSCSQGEDQAYLFNVLSKLGAYSSNGPEAVSRPAESPWFISEFPNGAVSIATHYRTLEECWPGTFFRDEEADNQLVKQLNLPTDKIDAQDALILGHNISYNGIGHVSYRLNKQGVPIGFSGIETTGITINNKSYNFSDQPVNLTFTWIDEHILNRLYGEKTVPGTEISKNRVPGTERTMNTHNPLISSILVMNCDQPGNFSIPIPVEYADVIEDDCQLLYWGDDLLSENDLKEIDHTCQYEKDELAIRFETTKAGWYVLIH